MARRARRARGARGAGRAERGRARAGVAVLALTGVAAIAALAALLAAARPAAAPSGEPAAISQPSSTPAPAVTPVPDAPTVQPADALTPCPRVGEDRTLRVLTFNIHGGFGHGRYSLDTIAEEIADLAPDVVLLQEVDRHRRRSGGRDQPALLAERLGLQVAFGANRIRPAYARASTRQEYGTVILSRYPILASRNVHLPNATGHERRGLLRATLDVRGRTVDVYTTHLAHDSALLRVAQARAIRDLLRDRDRPAVLGGDLNAEPDSPVLEILTSERLADSWRTERDGEGNTAPTFSPRHRIDYVLHDAELAATAAATHRSEMSDHLALLVTLRLLAPRACSS